MMTAEILYSLFILGFIIVVLVSLFYERKAHIPPVPTLPWVKNKIITLLLKYQNASDVLQIAELGSGWGGLCFQMARRFPNGTITGFEISPFPYWTSKLRQFFSRKDVKFSGHDFFQEDLSGYDVIVCYLSFKHMKWLKDKFEEELKPGTLIISNAFPIPDWEPLETTSTNIFVKIPVYVYRVV